MGQSRTSEPTWENLLDTIVQHTEYHASNDTLLAVEQTWYIRNNELHYIVFKTIDLTNGFVVTDEHWVPPGNIPIIYDGQLTIYLPYVSFGYELPGYYPRSMTVSEDLCVSEIGCTECFDISQAFEVKVYTIPRKTYNKRLVKVGSSQ